MAFGDFGFRTPLRGQNVEMMCQFQKQNKVDAILSLGDNFYNYGVKSTTDPQWHDFEKTFHPLQCPFYAVLGNHDYLGDIKAQIDYASSKKDTHWKMPSRYYQKTFRSNGVSVDVFFLDTFTLSPHESRLNSIAMGMHHFDQLFGQKDWEQYRWLERNLEKSTATWRVVVGHYPVFSNGRHGNNKDLIQDLLPILKRYNVDFYLSGHDHDLEFMRKEDINFIVSGTGCSSNPVSLSHQSIYASDSTTFGFHLMRFTNEFVRFGFITNQGTHMWYSVPKQKNVHYI
jgi:acid phosphatase